MLLFQRPIYYGRLRKRYQRFFMEVMLDSGEVIIAHTPNTGAMIGLLAENNRVMLTSRREPKHHLPYTVQAIEIDQRFVGINTFLPNRLIKESLSSPLLSELRDYRQIQTEVAYGRQLRSRVDFFCSQSASNKPSLYLEIKNVTLKTGHHAQFPDAVSARAHKHVDELVDAMEKGNRAALWFVVQRQDCQVFSVASHIDKVYAQKVHDAQLRGLKIRALCARIDERGLTLTHEIPCQF
jgi:sugar fermentation stimulation protein A